MSGLGRRGFLRGAGAGLAAARLQPSRPFCGSSRRAFPTSGSATRFASTILTLARNGRTVEEATATLAGGQSLDDLVGETLFRTVEAAEAHRLCAIPQTFRSGKSIEDVAALARRRGVDILV